MDTERSLQAIANMNAKFSAVADRVARLDSLIGPGDLESLKRAYFSICEIVEDLQALKGESEMAELSSSGGVPLINDVSSLLMQTLTLKKHITIAIAQHPAMKDVLEKQQQQQQQQQQGQQQRSAEPTPAPAPAAAPAAAAAAPSSPSDMPSARAALVQMAQTPLNRSEIAQLLMYTAKAFELERITARQKGQIKDLICHRAGHLRIVLQQTEIAVLLEALRIIGGEP